MAKRITKVYTRTGDDGKTGLGDGSRVEKSSLRIDVIGEIDELNSILGLLVAQELPKEIDEHLQSIQHKLFDIGGELSIPGSIFITEQNVQSLEGLIDLFNENIPSLTEFILPGGNEAASLCFLVRAVCRRAERQLVRLLKNEQINPNTLSYINRLSDLLFVLARSINREGGGKEIYWKKGEG